MSADEDEIKRRAVQEILEETRRAEQRADVGGSLGWLKPKYTGFNKRFLNNTVVSAVKTNSRLTNTQPLEKVERPEKKLEDLPTRLPEKRKLNSKIKLSSKSRFQAYIVSKKREQIQTENKNQVNNEPESTSSDVQELLLEDQATKSSVGHSEANSKELQEK